MENKMFCYQCQETAGCAGCTKSGVCGKGPRTAALQDMLVWVTKGLSEVAVRMREENQNVPDGVNSQVVENLFITITNANFDDEAIIRKIKETLEMKRELAKSLSGTEPMSPAALWDDAEHMEEKAKSVGVLSTEDEDIRSLRELITYGLKGMAAYLKHAAALEAKAENRNTAEGKRDTAAFLEKALAATLNPALTAEELTALALETGEYGVTAWRFSMRQIPPHMAIRRLRRSASGSERIREFSYPAMIYTIWNSFWSRRTEPASMCTLIQRCFRRTIIRPLRNTLILWEITEMHGGNRRKSLRRSAGRFC